MSSFDVGRVALLLAIALSSRALAQSTGAIQGFVLDAISQAPVPEAVVVVRSPSLQGEQSTVSDRTGHFHISLLPVGEYSLSVQRDAYRPLVHDTSIRLRLDQTLALTLSVVPEAPSAGSAVVSAPRPVIDTFTTQSGGVVGAEQMRIVPYGRTLRNFEAVATSIPGVSEDRYGLSMRGSGSPEGLYIIDGINVTDPSVGTQGTTLLQDFVEQVEVKTGGYQAEFGRSSGGVVNVVTKSGGNEPRIPGQEGRASLLANVEHAADVGMRELAGDADFPMEPSPVPMRLRRVACPDPVLSCLQPIADRSATVDYWRRVTAEPAKRPSPRA